MECLARVEEAMSAPPVAVSPEETVHRAVRLMEAHGVGSIVIVDEEERPVAVFTERDLVRCIAEHGPDALGMTVNECGSRCALAVKSSDCVTEALATMLSCRVRMAPVVDETGRLVGVITVEDVAAKIAATG